MKTLVTPRMASDWLGQNKINRSLSKELVGRYALDMASKRWVYNPNAGIMFSTDSDLLDGQHRLHAIVQAETLDPKFKGVELAVYRDVDSRVRPVIDIGRTRSLADVFHMEGHANATIAAAAAQLVLNYLDGARMGRMRSKPEKYEFVTANPELFHYATLAANAGRAARPSALAAVLFLGTRAGGLSDHAERFAGGIADGAELTVGDPRLTLRESLYRQRSVKGGGSSIGWAFAATVLAWNTFVVRRELHGLRVTLTDQGDFNINPVLGGPVLGAGVDQLGKAQLGQKVKDIVESARKDWERRAAPAEVQATA